MNFSLVATPSRFILNLTGSTSAWVSCSDFVGLYGLDGLKHLSANLALSTLTREPTDFPRIDSILRRRNLARVSRKLAKNRHFLRPKNFRNMPLNVRLKKTASVYRQAIQHVGEVKDERSNSSESGVQVPSRSQDPSRNFANR